jgi:hypothetical protein
MKKINWKYFVGGKLAAAACGGCLFLFTMSASAGLLGFDNLGNVEAPIPTGYGNLQWTNFWSLDAATYETKSGYQADMISKNNVAYNAYGNPASIYVTSGSFRPVMAFMTAAWTNNLKVLIKGYLRGKLVFTHTYILSTTRPSLVAFGNVNVDMLDFSTSDNTQFAMDDLLVQ